MIRQDFVRRAACVAVASLCLPMAGAAETVRYEYDVLGRLTEVEKVSGPANGTVTTYSLDAAGNRSNVTVTGAVGSGKVVNPSFETPSVGSSYQYRPSATAGMAFNGNAGIAGNGSAWGFTAPAGTQVAFLQSTNNSPGSITQSVSELTAGKTYEVRFWSASRAGFAPTSITVSVDGAVKGTFSTTSSFAPYRSSTFTPQGTTVTLTFATASTAADTASGLDLVAVVPQ